MLLLALLAPFAGLILCLLLVVAIVYTNSYASLYRLLSSCCGPAGRRRQHGFCGSKTHIGDGGARPVVFSCVSMRGLQIEPEADVCDKDVTCQLGDKQQQEVLQLMRTHGYRNSNVYTTFSNPEMQMFLASGIGCVPYSIAAHWGAKVVCAVGDPVCQAQHTLTVMQLFKQTFPEAIFIDLSKGTAQLLADQDAAEGGASVAVNDLGTEAVIDIQKFNFEHNKKTKHIRRRAEMAARAGLIVEELNAHSSAAIKAQVSQMALEWQQGKECTDDIKIFSRAIPFQHLGRETDVRVFIARTLEPGEVPPLTVPEVAAAWERKLQAAAAAQQPEVIKAANETAVPKDPSKLSRKQRKLLERVQHAKALRQAQHGSITGSTPASTDTTAGAAERSPASAPAMFVGTTHMRKDQQPQQQHHQQQLLVTPASYTGSSAAPSADMTAVVKLSPTAVTTFSKGPGYSSFSIVAAAASSSDISSTANSKTGTTHSSSSSALTRATSNLTTTSTISTCGESSVGSGGHIHACVILDPVYSDGRVIGYLAERLFLSPRGVKGAVKLVMRDVLGLLKVEGRQVLNLGLAVAFEIKEGSYHGFNECGWLTRNLQLCFEYGNDLYAFKNLADAKASWGGGYNAETDTYKHSEAVRLSRRFAVLPPSWRWQGGHGPFLMAVMLRHAGALGDPWELLAFWRYF